MVSGGVGLNSSASSDDIGEFKRFIKGWRGMISRGENGDIVHSGEIMSRCEIGSSRIE